VDFAFFEAARFTALLITSKVFSLLIKIRLNRLALLLFPIILSIINMKATSIISAAVLLVSSVSASNDPRECEGEG
jgi:hypothetical protein